MTPINYDKYEGHTELKPCPFCGGEAKVRNVGNNYTKKRRTDIVCTTVGCTPEMRVGAINHSHEWTEQKAIEKWNTRADNALLKRCRELEGALSRQGDNMAFVLNNMPVPLEWYDKFTYELEEDRKALQAQETPHD